MTPIEYKGLSKDEIYLISRFEFEKQKLVTTQFAQKIFSDKNKASRVLSCLKKKKRLLQLEKGKYFLVPIKAPNQMWTPNEFVVAGLWMGNASYYVGYFTMYNYWGFTEQIPQTIFVLNTARSRKKVIGGIRFEAVKIDKKKYYGIQKIKTEGEEICISDKERTLVDFIYNPLGSFRNLKEGLQNSFEDVDFEKFISYLKRFPVAAVRKRAGYLLEEFGCNKKLLANLSKSIDDNESYAMLDPYSTTRTGKMDKRWKIIVNR
jgi:predicted transcriptional regulator of viral defense system